MNQQLSNIELLIQQSALTDGEKQKLLKEISNADKQWNIIEFKLDRTEKVKKTTSVLLEETIEELEQKRKAVEAHNKELEIQNALERVRAVAMGMKEPADMLDVCKTISHQLQSLNVKEIRNVQTAIFYESKCTYMNYEYYAKHDKTFITETSYTNNKIHLEFAEKMLKGSGEFMVAHITGDEVKEWIAYQKTTNVFIDDYLNTASSLNYYWYSLGPVALGISTYSPLKEEDINLFRRFLKVFELAYRRYLDIEKALSQAREAKIEAALERVRSRSLAVHKSDEFNEVIKVVFERLQELEIPMTSVSINIIIEGSKDTEAYICGAGEDGLALSHIRLIHFDHPIFNDRYDAYEKNLEFFTKTYNAEEKNSFYEYEFEVSDLKYIPADIKKMVMESERYTFSVAFTKNSMIVVNDFEGKSLSSTEIDIVKRFARVFEQAYIRFLDLQKAEAQAREAEIELGLERVRARAMAMQTSEELNPLIGTVFTELTKLDLLLTRCVILIYEGNEKGVRWWMANSETPSTPMNFFVKYADIPFFNEYLKGWYNRSLKWQYCLEGENKIKTDDFLFTETELSLLPDFVIAGMRAPDRVYLNASFNNFGNLTLATLEPLSEEHFNILLRFGKVFDLTYTRFNDLKQAEAQARESQIQLALERVRARTMAMYKSSELFETAELLFSQFKDLGYKPDRITIGIMQEEKQVLELWATSGEANEQKQFYELPLNEPHVLSKCVKAWKEKNKSLVFVLNGQPLKEYAEFWKSLGAAQDARSTVDQVVFNFAFFSKGYLGFISFEYVPPQTIELLERFAGVFNLTYTRFLDLQKAEAQARESQIQLALERVRARTMAMKKSEEVINVCEVMYKELVSLGFTNIRNAQIAIKNDAAASYLISVYSNNEVLVMKEAPYKSSPIVEELYKELGKSKDAFFQKEFSGKKFNDWRKWRLEVSALTDSREAVATSMCFYLYSIGSGHLGISTYNAITNEQVEIIKRFKDVFELCYTRYTDVVKAEAQAREAQIETALEKVRSRSLAMHKSDEVIDVAKTVFEKLDELNIKLNTAFILVFKQGFRDSEWWLVNKHDQQYSSVFVKYVDIIILREQFEAKEQGKELFAATYYGEDKKELFRYLFTQTDFKYAPAERQQYIFETNAVSISMAITNKIAIQITRHTEQPFSNEENEIVKRFTKVFDQSYTRFLDLQKAEAQARESEIELALERVRARTMAMQHSDELADASLLLDSQIRALGIKTRGCAFNIYGEKDSTEWFSSEMGTMPTYKTPRENVFLTYYEAGKTGVPMYIDSFVGEACTAHYNYLCTLPVMGDALKEIIKSGGAFPTQQIDHVTYFKYGYLLFITLEPIPEAHDIFIRFAKVFQQTYTRFLDLKKAEAGVREAKIEAALERVRGKAMAMHSSKDLAETIHVFYHEIELLSATPQRCGVGLMNKESRVCKLSTMTTTEEGEPVEVIGKLDLQGHPVLDGIYNNWLNQKEYHPVLRGNEIKEYYKLIRPQISYPDYPNDMAQYGYFFFFPEGGAFAWTEKELPEVELQIYRRFTSVLSLTYKRCHELQQAETSAKEAIKQAALDRIRADIASMRTVNDLDRITPLIWNELNILGIPFIRCGVFIMNDEQHLIHTFLSTPDGKAIAAFHIPYNTPGNIKHVINHWHNNKNYIDHWDEDAFTTFAETLVTQGALTSPEQYLKTIPHGGFYLHFLPFLQGMLYVGNTTQLSEDEISLIQSLADAFSTAYARYEDFNKLEAAKKQVDKTLVELKQTQQQLVQSEKMASLGELTAGIAHEIQNPLNFVNNFSEVSKELIDEMRIALENGDKEEAEQIANDIIQNLEKINHHGKRADAIVKNMLQHSRKIEGTKELTDINALCDEYLRLSFHGMRAKDKSFNADFKMKFDEGIGKINIVPQDIGRVLLNLFNNAFYAVNEKKKVDGSAYVPIVTIVTKKLNTTIEIKVEDNGNGIPQNIIDKIFQPFFTTKPTGEGTGLGLSLAYDIITKEHNGTIKVESKEDEGSAFIIQLL